MGSPICSVSGLQCLEQGKPCTEFWQEQTYVYAGLCDNVAMHFRVHMHSVGYRLSALLCTGGQCIGSAMCHVILASACDNTL